MNKSSKKLRIQFSGLISVLLAVYDVAAMLASYFLALLLRFDGRFSSIDKPYIEVYLKLMPFYVVVGLIIFWMMKLYHSLWKYVSLKEGVRAVIGSLIASSVLTCTVTIYRMPVSFYLFGAVIQVILVVSARFAYRFILFIVANLENNDSGDFTGKRVMIIGAGDAGQMIIKDMNRSEKVKEKVVCIIDDDSSKWGRYIEGIPIIGGRDEIVKAAEKYGIDSIYVTMPSASAETLKDILNICSQTDCKLKNLPGMYQFVTDDIKTSSMKDVSVEYLLGRDPIKAVPLVQSFAGK